MLYSFLLKGSFQDSVSLMLLSRSLSDYDDVNKVSVMMGTPANKDVFRETGLWHDDLADATPNDICVVIDSDADEAIVASVRERLEAGLTALSQSRKSGGQSFPTVRSWRRACQMLPDANLTLISIAGAYAFEPAMAALKAGQHVMLFSDNVSLEQELALKQYGRDQRLLVMGPDCGTTIVSGAPLAFSNVVAKGPVGVVGASGTGIQEITTQLARLGSGITHAIGLGGRDLSETIGGLSALTALEMMAADPACKIVAFVSKPPAASVKARIIEAMQALGKPVVALFLGEVPARRRVGNVHLAYTLDEAARMAAELANIELQMADLPSVAGKKLSGLYSGGTLAAEAAMLLAEAMGAETDHEHAEGYMFRHDGHTIIDLGDDVYTRGRPHPMIDPTLRMQMIKDTGDDENCGVLLLDVVLGFGAHADPAGEIARAVAEAQARRAGKSPLVVIATVTGTREDPQDLEAQMEVLEDAGVVLADNVQSAILLAHRLLEAGTASEGSVPALFDSPARVINIGLRGFAEDLHKNGTAVVQLQWAPTAGGNERLQRLLAQMV